MSIQSKIRYGKKEVNRLNKSPEVLEIFYKILRDRLSLIKDGEATNANIQHTIYKYSNKTGKTNQSYYRPDIDQGLLVTARLDPEIILQVIEIHKKILGYYPTTQEVINNLFMWFYLIYNDPLHPKPILPYIPHKISKKKTIKYKVRKKFKPYFKNIMRSW